MGSVGYVAKTIPSPTTQQERDYSTAQEGARKAAERGVRSLQARDKSIRKGVSIEFWDWDMQEMIIKFAAIKHNMILDLYHQCCLLSLLY